MKKLVLIMIAIAISMSVMAQEKTKVKEAGLVFNDMDNFGLTYRIGSTHSLWRFNTLLFTGSNSIATSKELQSSNNKIGFGVKIGKEYRKDIAKNLELRFGADLSFNYIQSSNEYNKRESNDFDRLEESVTYVPGANLVLGLNYVINDKFIIGAEILPYFSYSYEEQEITSFAESAIDNVVTNKYISGFNFGLSNSSVLLSLVYRL